jgi:hypothetical protein
MYLSLLLIFSFSGNVPTPGKFDSGRVTLTTFRPCEELNSVSAPTDTSLSEPRAALVDKYPPAIIEVKQAQPTAEGALENSREFREAARKAWSAVSFGQLPQEAGFLVSPNGRSSPVELGREVGPYETVGKTVFRIPPGGAFATLHSHPRKTLTRNWEQEPSANDKAVAIRNRKNVYVTTSEGLFLVEPDGNVVHVFHSATWMTDKKAK